MAYAQLKQTKTRLGLSDSENDSDEFINDMMVEADNYVNIQLQPFEETLPLPNPDEELKTLASSLAAAMFNYWNPASKEKSIDAVTKWEKKIEAHIQATYAKRSAGGLAQKDNFLVSDSSTTGLETG